MTKSNRLILVAAALIIGSILLIIANDFRYSIGALVLKVAGLSVFMYALYLQAKGKRKRS